MRYGKNPASYYDVLQVHPASSDDDVRKAYHRMAKIYHPDRNPADRRNAAEERFHLICEAYEALQTKEKRLAYNRFLHVRLNGKFGGYNAGNDNPGGITTPWAWLDKILKRKDTNG